MDFSFCGVDVSAYGLHYVPKAENIFVSWNEYETHSLEVAGHDGGYWFGTTVKPKVFELECYFEAITNLQMKKIQALFSRGRTGELIFDRRPFLIYTATVTEFLAPTMYPGNNGTLSVVLTAYYPFAKMDRTSVSSYTAYGTDYETILKDSTGILLTTRTPPKVFYGTITSAQDFLLYNAGDERADTIIKIAGNVGTGVLIHNYATGQTCEVVGLTAENSTSSGLWLEIDSASGKVTLTDGTTPSMAFLYHDRGFVQLDGGSYVTRGVAVTYTGSTVTSSGNFSPDMVGRYIYISDAWRRITNYTDVNTITVDYTYGTPGSATADIAGMNRISITPVTTMSLTKLEFVYYPTFR